MRIVRAVPGRRWNAASPPSGPTFLAPDELVLNTDEPGMTIVTNQV